MAGTNVTYNGNSLQTNNIIIQDIDHESLPDNISEEFKLVNVPRFILPYPDDFQPKRIMVSGILQTSGVAALDTLIDTFRGYFIGTLKNLDIDYGGGTRRYIIAKASASISRPGGLAWAKFTLDLVTASLATATTSSTILNSTGRTAAVATDAVTFPGNAPYQQPIWTITLSALNTGGTGKTVNISNDANGQAVSITQTVWTAGSVITVDSQNQSVKINGVETAFSGSFPEFPPGSGTLGYSDDFISRTWSINVIAFPQYL